MIIEHLFRKLKSMGSTIEQNDLSQTYSFNPEVIWPFLIRNVYLSSQKGLYIFYVGDFGKKNFREKYWVLWSCPKCQKMVICVKKA